MISPIENNGMVLRMQDFSTVRQNEENISVNQQLHIQDSKSKSDDINAHSVQSKDDSDGADTHHDAREEGRNKYVNMRKKKNGDELPKEGRVIAKGKGGFDITI